jgi:hypothetical protein
MKEERLNHPMRARRRRFIFSLILLVLLVAVVLLLFAQLPESLFKHGEAPREDGAIAVHFCPAEDCEAVLSAALNSSSDIRCTLYDIDLPALERILLAKNASVLVFDENYKGFGTSVHNARNGLMHDKFCVLDNETVITGSANPTAGLFKNDNNIVIPGSYNPTSNGNTRNDENVLIIHDPAVAAQYGKEFERVYAQALSK